METRETTGGCPAQPPDYVTITEAAARLGYHRTALLRALRSQGIPVVRFGRAWLVRPADLARFVPRPPGRPALTDEPFFFNLAEAAEMLGIGRATAYRLARSGELPGVVRIGKSYRVSRAALYALAGVPWSPPAEERTDSGNAG